MINVTTATLSNDVIGNIIFCHLLLPALATCSRVCRAWNKMAKEHINAFSPTEAFGPKEWYTYFGCRVRNVPRLPSDIIKRLSELDKDNVLVLIPEVVNGQPLTLKTLGELVQKPLQGHVAKYNRCILDEYVDQPTLKSHWALLTRTVIESSRNKLYKDERAILAQYSQSTKLDYGIPTVLDATVCNFMEYVRTGTWLYGDNPFTYTWCQEENSAHYNLVVGGGSAAGLFVVYIFGTFGYLGFGGLRKL